MVIRKHPKGFSAIEGILIVVFIVILAGTGWYVWHTRHQKQTTTPTATTTSSAKTTTPMPDPTADWKSYSNESGKYSVKYPNNMTYSYCETTVLFDPASTGVANGSEACGDAGPQVAIRVKSVEGDQRGKESDLVGGYDVTDASTGAVVTDGGVHGESKKGTVTEENQVGPQDKGYTQILYVFYTNGRTYFCLYSQPSNPTVPIATFDLIVKKTLKFTS